MIVRVCVCVCVYVCVCVFACACMCACVSMCKLLQGSHHKDQTTRQDIGKEK